MKEYFRQYERLLSLTNLVTKQHTDSKQELDASLKRTSAFLKALGSPEKKMDFIHVGGTSGKGSVTQHVHSILQEAGEAVGSYTSPHTTTYLERFHFGDGLLKPGLLAQCIDEVITVYDGFLRKHGWLTFFELSTCIAIYAIKKAGAEYCVLEVGCGGRYDATNVIPKPAVAVITNIDKDHTEILGSTLAEIAYEKAGIIKPHGVVLCGETRPSLKTIFQKEANKQQASLFFIPPPVTKLLPKQAGLAQQHNAALAMQASKELGVKVSVMKRANKNLQRLPCRFETVQQDPLVILDGAHSPAKMEATVRLIQTLHRPIRVLFGSVHNKDVENMLRPLSRVVDRISTTRFTSTFRKAAVPSQLLKLVTPKKRGIAYLDPFDALKAELAGMAKNEILIVTGSLYLAGELRAQWISENQILKNASSF